MYNKLFSFVRFYLTITHFIQKYIRTLYCMENKNKNIHYFSTLIKILQYIPQIATDATHVLHY